MQRLRTSRRLARVSNGILIQDKQLLIPPLHSGLRILAVSALCLVVYVASLYRFATSDLAPQGKSGDFLLQAFRPKGR